MISIFIKYYYNEGAMKNLRKIALLSGVVLLTLAGCTDELAVHCLETSDTFEYAEGKCFQSSRSDIVETLFLMNLPTNPEADPEAYTYDIEWNKSINTDNFSFTDGLKEKRIIEVFRWSDTILKINFHGRVTDKEATFGYLKVNPSAFKVKSERVKQAYLYAYVAIGDTTALVDKPADK